MLLEEIETEIDLINTSVERPFRAATMSVCAKPGIVPSRPRRSAIRWQRFVRNDTYRRHWQHRLLLVEVVAATAERAISLAERRGLRGYDAVHLTAALAVAEARQVLSLATLTFVSADVAQRQAASAENLLVEDPNTYPEEAGSTQKGRG